MSLLCKQFILICINWTFFSLLSYILVSNRETKRDARSTHPEIDRLVEQHLDHFPAHIDQAWFNQAAIITSTERSSRGATAIVQKIGGDIFVDLLAFTTPYSWDRLRLQHILSMMKKAIKKGDHEDFEMIINVHDCPLRDHKNLPPNIPIFSITRCKGTNFVPLPQWYRMRDGKWNDWDNVIDTSIKTNPTISKEGKAVFRGAFRHSVLQNENGALKFVNITNENWREVGRTKLLHLQGENPHLYNIGVYTQNSEEWRLITSQARGNNGTRLTMKEQAESFKYVVHAEGACGWADRLKNFLVHGAVILKQEAVCQEFFEPLLRPWIHYIPIDNLMHNLTDTIQYTDENTTKFIHENTKNFANTFLRQSAWEYYFNSVIRKYSMLWKGVQIIRRPGTRKFSKEAKCAFRFKGICDDSAAYE